MIRSTALMATCTVFQLCGSPTVRAADSAHQILCRDHKQALEVLADRLQPEGAPPQKLLIVWLIDQSSSVNRTVFLKVQPSIRNFYRSLEPANLKSVVVGFKETVDHVLPEPVSDVKRVRDALRVSPIKRKSPENLCHALLECVERYSSIAESEKRQLVTVVITDESPSDAGDPNFGRDDDIDHLEQSIAACRQAKSRVFVLGLEAIFGGPDDSQYMVYPADRARLMYFTRCGPEAAGIERLAWNGLKIWKLQIPSGFAPYSLARMCQATGGVCLVLPRDSKPKQRDRQVMIGYEPDLLPRSAYLATVKMNPLRSACAVAIGKLDPYRNPELVLPDSFPVAPEEFHRVYQETLERASVTRKQVDSAIATLEAVRPGIKTESSKRARANYQLLDAQCAAARLRLTQYLAAMHGRMIQGLEVAKAKHNRWGVYSTKKPRPVSADEAAEILRVYRLDSITVEAFQHQLKLEQKQAEKRLEQVVNDHPGTPWAKLADWQRANSLSVTFRSYFRSDRLVELRKRTPPAD